MQTLWVFVNSYLFEEYSMRGFLFKRIVWAVLGMNCVSFSIRTTKAEVI